MTPRDVSITPLGDAALLARLTAVDAEYERASALADSMADDPPPGVNDAAAAYATVAVYFDAGVVTYDAVAAHVRQRLDALAAEEQPRTPAAPVAIPVRYDGADLDDACERLGITRAGFIELHAGREYVARAVGFVPGFAYLGELDERLRLPRRDAPRARVPAGAVAIAAGSTAVYPFATPGGWHLVGSTRAVMFDSARERPSLITVGARVCFIPE